GITPAGRPIAVFVQTDDIGFRYDAMIPIERAPEGRPNLTPEIRFGTTPSGRALRFVHKGPYDDIDSTYETVTAYLDAKNIEVKDSFVEEYVSDLNSADDSNLEINIFAMPKEVFASGATAFAGRSAPTSRTPARKRLVARPYARRCPPGSGRPSYPPSAPLRRCLAASSST
ncbi:MAG: GyrI-like domain-containing protein, partial [Microvirga sp.]